MVSPSKQQPKRSLCDESEFPDSEDGECATRVIKRQKSVVCESFITSSPYFPTQRTSQAMATIVINDENLVYNNGCDPAFPLLPTPQHNYVDSCEEEIKTSLFSPTFSFQKDSESSSEDELSVEDETIIPTSNGLVGTTEEQQESWYAAESNLDELEEEEEEEVVVEFNPYLFIKNLPKHQPQKRTLLPPQLSTDPKYCLVLDLDETLVHCSTEALFPADLVFPVTFNNVEYTVFARKRPFIEEFLSHMAVHFEIVVFTASQEVYADRLLNILDPDRKYIRHRLFRDSCICVDGNYLKDLTILGRDLSKVIIVDNSPQAFGYQVDNGIPIESWFDDEADQELLRLVPFLKSMVDEPDVRPHIRDKFKLHELISRS